MHIRGFGHPGGTVNAPLDSRLRRARNNPKRLRVWRGALGLTLLLAACAYKPTIPPSQGHISRESVTPAGDADKILPPVTNGTYVPPPEGLPRLDEIAIYTVDYDYIEANTRQLKAKFAEIFQ